MLRLRTSTGLSLLALAIGIAGTGWLSTLTSRWSALPQTASAASTEHRVPVRVRPRRPNQQHGSVSVVMPSRQAAVSSPISDLFGGASVKSSPELIPLMTPSDHSQPWYKLQGHLDGRVVLHLTIDGTGRVITAEMRESSGDPILDSHALRSVRLWRFAVPPDRPDGLSGDLPMRFASRRHEVASAV